MDKSILQELDMKLFIIIAFMLTISTVQAQVFKCETNNGKIVYQQTECTNSKKQEEIIIEEFDQDKILKAQEKLNTELQQHYQMEAARAEHDLKEREIMAIEDQARSNEDLSDAARDNAYAIERNTDAIRSRGQGDYYYNPRRYRPVHRPGHFPKYDKPHVKPHLPKPGVHATINIK